MKELKEKEQFVKDFAEKYPVVQSFHTGLWGWETIYDCINLNECKYTSRLAATRTRNKLARDKFEWLETPSPWDGNWRDDE